MSKYYSFFKNSLAEALVYRANVFLIFFSQVVSLTVFIFLWQAIYAQNNQVGNYSLEELVTYYVLSGFLSFVIQGVDVAWRVGDEINLGKFTNFILKPVSYFWTTFFVVLGKVFFNFILVSLLVLLLEIFAPRLVLNFFSFGERNWFFLLAVSLSFCLFFLIFFLVGIATFWFGQIKGFNFFLRTIMFFWSGSIIPLDLLPDWATKVNQFLPFQYITWLPIQIFQGKVPLNLQLFLPAISWILLLVFLNKFIFKKGKKKYEGFGA